MIFEEIKHIKENDNALKKFGFSVGGMLSLIGIILLFTGRALYLYFFVVGFGLILLGLFYPKVLKFPNRAWMAMAIVLGWIMTRVILTILFYLAITPISLIARLAGKKFLDLKIDRSKGTYWEKREKKNFNHEDYDRQF